MSYSIPFDGEENAAWGSERGSKNLKVFKIHCHRVNPGRF